jgi:hypothetical protein
MPSAQNGSCGPQKLNGQAWVPASLGSGAGRAFVIPENRVAVTASRIVENCIFVGLGSGLIVRDERSYRLECE